MYVVFAMTDTGLAKLACCHPLAVSLANVVEAISAPALVHRFPTWEPVFPPPLKNRMPLIAPSTSVRNLTPTSTALESSRDGSAGLAEAGQIVQGQDADDAPADVAPADGVSRLP